MDFRGRRFTGAVPPRTVCVLMPRDADSDRRGDEGPVSRAARQGTDTLVRTVYDELKRLARRQLRALPVGATLCTTELVHEAFLKLASPDEGWEGRAHFFGAAAQAMREVLVDFARRRQAAKRGGGWRAVSLQDASAALEIEMDQVLALDDALEHLDRVDERLRRVVEMRFFAGLSVPEIARLFGVSTRTVERDWLKARLFLLRALSTSERGPRG
jgi:RNA polymerase sigma factor (TIGR02999 family)